MTKVVPSLSEDAPSIRVVSRSDTPSSLSKATTATGSVADKIEPATRAAFQSQCGAPRNKTNLKRLCRGGQSTGKEHTNTQHPTRYCS